MGHRLHEPGSLPAGAAPWQSEHPGLFEALAPLQFTKFDPHTIAETGNKVIAVIDIEADHKGKHYIIPNEGHLWRLGLDGKVVSYQHLTDTALHWRMANGQ